jgi:hypothetical protein
MLSSTASVCARIGDERIAFLEREHPPAKYTIEKAKRI